MADLLQATPMKTWIARSAWRCYCCFCARSVRKNYVAVPAAILQEILFSIDLDGQAYGHQKAAT